MSQTYFQTALTLGLLGHKNAMVLLNIGSIRIYILTTGVVSNETNTDVRMYIEEFILVEIWIHCCTKLFMN